MWATPWASFIIMRGLDSIHSFIYIPHMIKLPGIHHFLIVSYDLSKSCSYSDLQNAYYVYIRWTMIYTVKCFKRERVSILSILETRLRHHYFYLGFVFPIQQIVVHHFCFTMITFDMSFYKVWLDNNSNICTLTEQLYVQ